jgi:putative SOS response-associated peptidase YedK
LCNDFGNRVPYRSYVEELTRLDLRLLSPGPEAAPNLEPRDEIWPTDPAPVIRAVAGGVELLEIQWGLVPSRPEAPVVINMRSEGRSFTRGRCLVPASHYYEFTGKRSPKTRWRFARTGEAWFCFAGLLGRGRTKEGEEVDAFALLTAEAGPDAAPYHDRQPIILDRDPRARGLGGVARSLPPGRASPAPLAVRQPSGGGSAARDDRGRSSVTSGFMRRAPPRRRP